MRKTSSRIMAMLLSLAMTASSLPAPVFGMSETEGTAAITAEGKVEQGTMEGLADNDELFAGYVNEKFGFKEEPRESSDDEGVVTSPAAYNRVLSEADQKLYDALLKEINKIADGTIQSTEIHVPLSEFGIKQGNYTAQELGVSAIVSNNQITQEAADAMYAKFQFDPETVMKHLSVDQPYALYWFDKTTGYQFVFPSVGANYQTGSGYVMYFAEDFVTMQMAVSADYRGTYAVTDYKTDKSLTSATSTALENAAKVINQNKYKLDYDKLCAYKDYICGEITYNQAAAQGGVSYGDPWQMIYVFDEKSSTNVVCEGYSKAFKYLVDHSVWHGDVTGCIIVEGIMQVEQKAERHMWNIVTINGANYLADITNSDAGSIGQDGGIFLNGYASGTADTYYVFSEGLYKPVIYAYDQPDMPDTYEISELTLSGTDYAPSTQTGHAWVVKAGTSTATCEQAGQETYECSICHLTKQETAQATGHKLTGTPAVAATCESAGNSAYWTCSDCGKYFSDINGTMEITANSWVIGALGHDYDDGVVTTQPTCTEKGVKTFTCRRNTSHTRTEEVEALGHNYDSGVVTTQPTCTGKGVKTFTCLRDPNHTRTEEVEALGHNYNGGEVTTPATCEANGVRTYTCQNDPNHKYTEVITALGHQWEFVGFTWTQITDGYTAVANYKCKNDATHLNTVTATVTATEVTGGKDYTATVTAAASLDHAEHTSTKHVAHVHTLSGTPAVAATCTTPGNSAYWTCAGCGLYFSDDAGNTEIVENSWVIPALGHDYDNGMVTTAPTCETPGVKTFTCSRDANHSYTEVVQALGHDYNDGVVTTDPTCETKGVRTFTCSRDASHTYTVEVAALGHAYNSGEVTTQPTCEGKGVRTFTCQHDANHKYTVEIAALGHVYDDGVVTTEPTCETKGVRTFTCSRDASHTYTVEIDALGHAYDSGVVTTQPTCEGKGVRTFTCGRNASHYYTEDIDAIGHDWEFTGFAWTQSGDGYTATADYRCKHDASHVNSVTATVTVADVTGGKDYTATVTAAASLDHVQHTSTNHVDIAHVHTLSGTPAVAATCTSPGKSAYWTCSGCGKYFSDQDGNTEIEANSWVINALGHDYGSGVVTTPATCEGKGVRTFTCSHDANHSYTEEIPELGHFYDNGVVTTAATCETNGVKTYTCQHDSSHKYTVDIPALGHDYDNGVVTTPATCETKGVKTYTCSHDASHTYTVEIAALNHDYDNGVVTTQPTCETKGVRTYTCSHDASHTYTTDIAALGHDWEFTGFSWTQVADGYTAVANYKCKNNAAHVNTVTATVTVADVTGGKDYTATVTAAASLDHTQHTSTNHVDIAHVHTLSGTPAVAATCTTAGNSAYWTCSGCGKHFSDENGTIEIEGNSWVIAALGHDYDNGVVTTAATCETAGVKTYTCHRNPSHTRTETITALGHDYDDGVVTTAATCETAGVKTYTCHRDPSHTRTETITALGHDYDDGVVTTAATCETAGVKTYTCHRDPSHTRTETITALGHDYDDGVVTTAATCLTDGVKTYTCHRNPSHTRTETITALGHILSGIPAVDATCESAGNSAYWTCSRCKKYFSDANATTEIAENSWVIQATGHDWEFVGFTWTQILDGYTAVANYKCKNDAAHESTVIASVTEAEVTGGKDYSATVTAAASLDHTQHTATKHVNNDGHVHTLRGTRAVAATCTRDGNSAYWTCTDCGLYFADKEALQEIEEGSWVIPALGHDYQVMTSIIKASCERGGLEIVVCSHNPMHVKMQTVPATGHDWDEGVVTKAPTRWSTGIRTYTCRNNPTHRRTEVIPATGSGETPPAVPAFNWWNIFWWLRPHSRG